MFQVQYNVINFMYIGMNVEYICKKFFRSKVKVT